VPYRYHAIATLADKVITTYGTRGFWNSTTGKGYYLTTASGSGGLSGCATVAATTSDVVSW
jgi:hypothetical protein